MTFRLGGNIIKTRTKVILLVLVVIVALLMFTAYSMRSYINAFIISVTKTSEELQQMMENSKSPEKLLENYDGINVRDLTPEEQEKLAKNELTEEEIIELIIGKSAEELLDAPLGSEITVPLPPNQDEFIVPDAPMADDPDLTDEPLPPEFTTPQQTDETPVRQPSQPEQTQKPEMETPIAPETQPPTIDKSEELKETNEKVARLVAQIYVIKSQSNNRLKTMEAEWKAEYHKVPSAERKATNLLATYVKRAVKIVAEWEAETDAQVEAILSEVETLLKQSGQSLELVDSLKKAYEDEKTYIKAYYMNKINKRL